MKQFIEINNCLFCDKELYAHTSYKTCRHSCYKITVWGGAYNDIKFIINNMEYTICYDNESIVLEDEEANIIKYISSNFTLAELKESIQDITSNIIFL